MTRPLFINGRFLTQTPTGMQRFAIQLLSHWDKRRAAENAPADIRVFLPPTERVLPEWETLAIETLPGGTGHLWEQTTLYRATRRGNLINLLGSGPLLHPRQIVTIHDASVHDTPQFYTRRYRMAHLAMGLMLGRRAKRVLTGSNFSKGRLQAAFGIDPDKISVIPIGCDHLLAVDSDDTILSRHGLKPQGYFLCVGSDTPNKNISSVFRAFAALETDTHRLVHAGARNTKVFRETGGDEDRNVLRLGHINDGELRALYESALAFVFPSRYEGFGIPPVEAMLLGCPVISSRGGSLPEVLGEAANFVNPDDTPQFSAALANIITDTALRDELIAAGKNRASQYTWTAAVERFDAIVRDFVA